MSFLRRLLGGRPAEPDAAEAGAGEPEAGAAEPGAHDVEEAERRHERELLAAEQERLDDLQRRQLRYAEHAWTPPPQGGERRADDEERAAGGEGGEPEG